MNKTCCLKLKGWISCILSSYYYSRVQAMHNSPQYAYMYRTFAGSDNRGFFQFVSAKASTMTRYLGLDVTLTKWLCSLYIHCVRWWAMHGWGMRHFFISMNIHGSEYALWEASGVAELVGQSLIGIASTWPCFCDCLIARGSSIFNLYIQFS